MSDYSFREEARGLLARIKDDPQMPYLKARICFIQVLAMMVEIHNDYVETSAELTVIRIPRIDNEQIDLLRQAFTDDIFPLIEWLSPRVDWEPTLITGVFP